jgi:NAD(P)-dependent dehydrogenase (short-subunit alcohol dehydrogenase family)
LRVEESFRYMQKGVHMGKIVVTMPENPGDLQVSSRPKPFSMRSDAAYLIVGGLGGLGRSVATWMAENGATNLLFLSRSADKLSLEDPFIEELDALGCMAQLIAGSVSNLEDVQKAVRDAHRPIAGVIQASMVLKVRIAATLGRTELTVSGLRISRHDLQGLASAYPP